MPSSFRPWATATAPDSSFIRMFMPTIERLPTSTPIRQGLWP